ncbi:calcium-binding protein, partial [Endozoicomonas sp. ONNA1]|uniref:calcium-binding protein n=1 Tax=Endozoicomonas sp. ONNA1 TaxID=2828740 RepID=UPI0027D22C7C
FDKALQNLDKAGLPDGQATRLPAAECVLCDGSGPTRTIMALMDRVSRHLDTIEISDRFNTIRQAAGDKGLLADSFLLLEQGRFAAVTTEDMLDNPGFRKNLLDLLRQALAEKQGLKPEQVIDRVVTLLNDSGYSADDTGYVKEQLLASPEFMEHLRARKGHTGGDGSEPGSPGDTKSGGGSKRPQGKFMRTLDMLDRSTKLSTGRMLFGAGNAFAGLATSTMTLVNLQKYGYAMPAEARNMAYAGAVLNIIGSNYSLAMSGNWLLSKTLVKTKNPAGAIGVAFKLGPKASRMVARALPLVGGVIALAAGTVSLAGNVDNAVAASKAGNRKQAAIFGAIAALDVITIGLDVLGLALDFIFPKLGLVVDLISTLLGFVQTALVALMPPPNARQDFDALLAGDEFKKYIEDKVAHFEKAGYRRLQLHLDASDFLDQDKYEDNLESLTKSIDRLLGGKRDKGLALEAGLNVRREVIGTTLRDYMYGKKGYKIFYGLDGDDTLIADKGELYGGSGNDRLILKKDGIAKGGTGRDTIRIERSGKAFGGPDSDRIWIDGSGTAYGNRGNDVLHLGYRGIGFGGPGGDTIFNGALQDGGDDNDRLIDDLGDIEQYGGTGDDLLQPGLGIGNIRGGHGNDTLVLPAQVRFPYSGYNTLHQRFRGYYLLPWTKSSAFFEVNLQEGRWRSHFAVYLQDHNLKRLAPDGNETGGTTLFRLLRIPERGFRSTKATPDEYLSPRKLYIAPLSEIKADYSRELVDKVLISDHLLTGYDKKHTGVRRISDQYSNQIFYYVGEIVYRVAHDRRGDKKKKRVHSNQDIHVISNSGKQRRGTRGYVYFSDQGIYLKSDQDLYYFSKQGLIERSKRNKPNGATVFYTTLFQLLETGGTVTGIENVVGSKPGLIVRGTAGPNKIYLKGGKNVAHTLGGNDVASAGSGTNLIHLGSGDDLALLGDGLNEVHGGP